VAKFVAQGDIDMDNTLEYPLKLKLISTSKSAEMDPWNIPVGVDGSFSSHREVEALLDPHGGD